MPTALRHLGGCFLLWTVLMVTAASCGVDGPDEPGETCNLEDCPGEDTGCTVRVCNDDGSCGTDTPMGTDCADDGGVVCDGNGNCVACVDDEDCSDGDTCMNGTCGTPSCTDGITNGPETDIDCGGGCGPCLNGQGCLVPTDCNSGVCSAETCVPCNGGDCPAGLTCDAQKNCT
ncbi:MAG TPA: hypothetical protein ENK57_24815 [Polyangiaceae bacterium]|nr:hypothetical protein [Polyangiaceae bacterium]